MTCIVTYPLKILYHFGDREAAASTAGSPERVKSCGIRLKRIQGVDGLAV